MASIGRSLWEQGCKHLLIAEEDWLEHAAGVLFQPMAGRPAAFSLQPEADDVYPVDEAEHDEVDEVCWQMTQRMRSCQMRLRR